MTRSDGSTSTSTAWAGSNFAAPPCSSSSARHADPIGLQPATAYEAVTRQMVVGLSEELREIKSRLNGLLFMVAGSVLLEVLTRVICDR